MADVRYDRRWLARLNATVRVIRGVGLVIVAAAGGRERADRRQRGAAGGALRAGDEIEIMQLVGAPFAYIRGPFVAEGLQGGMGALVAVVLLLATFAAIRARFGAVMADAVGLTGMAFVPGQLLLLLVVGGMALGCLGGFVVARGVR